MSSRLKHHLARLLILARRRLRHSFRIRHWQWECESCLDCGSCFRVLWAVKDSLWQEVMKSVDSGSGSLCPTCFIERADSREIIIKQSDFITFEPFLKGWDGDRDDR